MAPIGLGDGTGVPTVIHSAHSSQFLLKNSNNSSSDEHATEDAQHEHKKAPLCKVREHPQVLCWAWN